MNPERQVYLSMLADYIGQEATANALGDPVRNPTPVAVSLDLIGGNYNKGYMGLMGTMYTGKNSKIPGLPIQGGGFLENMLGKGSGKIDYLGGRAYGNSTARNDSNYGLQPYRAQTGPSHCCSN